MLVLANTEVMESRAILNANCPPEAAAACLNTPNPCWQIPRVGRRRDKQRTKD